MMMIAACCLVQPCMPTAQQYSLQEGVASGDGSHGQLAEAVDVGQGTHAVEDGRCKATSSMGQWEEGKRAACCH